MTSQGSDDDDDDPGCPVIGCVCDHFQIPKEIWV